jgi:hypothetical protein
MRRNWLRLCAVAAALFIAGCDEAGSKPDAKQPAPGGTSESMKHMEGAAGLAPPGGLQ